MTVNIIAVGKLKEQYWVDAIKEYSKRLSRYCNVAVIEIPEGKTMDIEAQNIIKKASGYVIAMDINGKMLCSSQLANTFANCLNAGKSEFSIIIGGSDGLANSVKQMADLCVSFGLVTYPHQLMRVIVFEQLYRAVTILKGITYHK